MQMPVVRLACKQEVYGLSANLKLVHHLRGWPNIKATLDLCKVFEAYTMRDGDCRLNDSTKF